MRLRYLILLTLLHSTLAYSGDPTTPTFFSIQLENDLFADGGDRYYTHGTEASWMQATEPPAWLRGFARLTGLYREDGDLRLVKYTLGQKMFTPENIQSSELLEHERPYAGYLYLSSAVMSRLPSIGKINQGNMYELTVGVIGPYAMGEEMQTGVHSLFSNTMPQGWEHQLENEMILGLSYTHFWRRIRGEGRTLQWASVPHMGMSIGNAYTYGSAGVIFRVGNRLHRDLSPPSIGPGFPGLAIFQPHEKQSWYLFLGLEGRMVLRDIFLDGNSFRDSHRVEKQYVVGDLQYGLAWLLDETRISISNMRRSREYVGQPENTRYGAINLTVMLK